MTVFHRHLVMDNSLAQPAGLVQSISYVASHSIKVTLLGLTMALHTGQYELYIIL